MNPEDYLRIDLELKTHSECPLMPSLDPTISVIIPSARPDQVIDTLNGLLSQSFVAHISEIIVVTPRLMNENSANDFIPKIKIVTVDQLYPPGKMRNVGAKLAGGDYFAFIDDDCVPEKEWLEKLINEISLHDDVGMIGCRVVSGKKGFWADCADNSLFSAYQYQKKMFIDLGSAAIVVRKRAFLQVEGFDEELKASEDWDLSLRVRHLGWRCLFTPEAEVLHFHGRDSFVAIARNAYLSGFRTGLTVQKRHYTYISWIAQLSVKMGTPFRYCLLILPYAALLTLVQGSQLVRSEFRKCFYLPVIFLCRLLYHFGVWRRLYDKTF